MGPAIEIAVRLQDDAWPVLCDPSRLESAVMNLAINAPDAMPGGGRLTISARNVLLSEANAAGQDEGAPGDHVELRSPKRAQA